MSKPDDIPQDVRKQAWEIYVKRCDELDRLPAEFEEEEVIDLLSRVIVAAQAAEREACALVAARQWPFTSAGWNDVAESASEITAREIAAAIRKRGEG